MQSSDTVWLKAPRFDTDANFGEYLSKVKTKLRAMNALHFFTNDEEGDDYWLEYFYDEVDPDEAAVEAVYYLK